MTKAQFFGHRAGVVCAVTALCVLLLVLNAKSTTAQSSAGAAVLVSEHESAVSLSWGDFDGDGLEDVFARYENGPDRLFRNDGDGSFVDVTAAAGFSTSQHSGAALWADFNSDGKLDLYVAAPRSDCRLFMNQGDGGFLDVTAEFGLGNNIGVHDATSIDYDNDGFPDLLLHADSGDHTFHNSAGTWFERIQLGRPIATRSNRLVSPGTDNRESVDGAIGANDAFRASRLEMGAGTSRNRPGSVSSVVGSVSRVSSPPGGAATSSIGAVACVDSVADDANSLNPCIKASTVPTLGMLYPMNIALNVSTFGDVGVGVFAGTGDKLEVGGTIKTLGFKMPVGASPDYVLTSDSFGTGTWQPAPSLSGFVSGSGTVGTLAKFTASGEIGTAGAALITDTLILGPSHDVALSLNVGSIYKNGSIFIHTKGGSFNDNTAIGHEALKNILPAGSGNTALGYRALLSSTTGSENTACGFGALLSNTTGLQNTASGFDALGGNVSGQRNTAHGKGALFSNTSGSMNTASGFGALSGLSSGISNVAVGNEALANLTTGSRNIAVGSNAGFSLTGGSDNIAIGNTGGASDVAAIRIGTSGTHTKAFMSGIRGVTTGFADGVAVLIDSAGQLGTVSSSRRFKSDIADMSDLSDGILRLRPVVFHYKQDQSVLSGGIPLEYGLIAEEVAEVFPDLVVYDEEGLPFTVKYHLLSAMLLNELKKIDARTNADRDRLLGLVNEHKLEIATLQGRMAMLEASLMAMPTPVETER